MSITGHETKENNCLCWCAGMPVSWGGDQRKAVNQNFRSKVKYCILRGQKNYDIRLSRLVDAWKTSGT